VLRDIHVSITEGFLYHKILIDRVGRLCFESSSLEHSTSSTSKLIHLAWPVLVAQLAMMANAVIDTAMAGRLSAIDLASVGIAASIMSTVLMTLISVLLALPPIIAHLYGAGQRADVGPEIHQSVWISLVLALVAVYLNGVSRGK